VSRHIAIYVRVSSTSQDHRSQLPDLERWANAQDDPVIWYDDKFTGKTMIRPGWNKLDEAIRFGKVSKVVVWRMDRLGRTASGLSALFDRLIDRKVNLVSLRDGIDLSTPAGRLMANVLASVAQYDNEVRSERVLAGQAKARKEGKRWGGSKLGTRKKVSPLTEKTIRRMKADGESIVAIANTVGLSRPTIYDVLRAESTPR
jgi:DNA invertase Pin-like site-specific DNA recombinase